MAFMSGRSGKIPYSISMKDESPFVFAGLWEGWKDPATNEWLRTCTIITGEPNEFVRETILGCPQYYRKSITMLGYRVKPEKEVLVPYPADRMKAWPIDAGVNSPKNNDPVF
jgi:putative SOS response-associated peptidase YedK